MFGDQLSQQTQNICTTSAQRLRRRSNIVKMFYKCFRITLTFGGVTEVSLTAAHLALHLDHIHVHLPGPLIQAVHVLRRGASYSRDAAGRLCCRVQTPRGYHVIRVNRSAA